VSHLQLDSCSGVLQFVAVCRSVSHSCLNLRCSVLQCVAIRCRVLLQCVAVCCSVLQHAVAVCCTRTNEGSRPSLLLQCVGVCYSMLQRAIELYSSVLPCAVAVYCHVMPCSVAVCYSVLQRVVACCGSELHSHERGIETLTARTSFCEEIHDVGKSLLSCYRERR